MPEGFRRVVWRATSWLNRRLSRVLGTADISPSTGDPDRPDLPCPVCGQPMSSHRLEVGDDGTRYLHHPTGPTADVMETGR